MTKPKKFRQVLWGVKNNGIVLLGHECKPLSVHTKEEAQRTWKKKGDKIIRLIIEEK